MTPTKTPAKKIIRKKVSGSPAIKTEATKKSATTLARLRTSVLEGIGTLSDLKRQKAGVLAQEKQIAADVLAGMQELDEPKIEAPSNDGHTITATVVEGTTMTLDETGLKKALGADTWNKVTTSVIDRNKLDAMIKSGEIKATTVARYTNESPRTAYVKITVK